MTYEKKNGEFACFKKQSKKGTNYFNGTLTLDGKEYWISIFNKHSQKGEQYLSGMVEPKQEKLPENVDAGWTEPPKQESITGITTDAYDPEKNEFKDGIPF